MFFEATRLPDLSTMTYEEIVGPDSLPSLVLELDEEFSCLEPFLQSVVLQHSMSSTTEGKGFVDSYRSPSKEFGPAAGKERRGKNSSWDRVALDLDLEERLLTFRARRGQEQKGLGETPAMTLMSENVLAQASLTTSSFFTGFDIRQLAAVSVFHASCSADLLLWTDLLQYC